MLDELLVVCAKRALSASRRLFNSWSRLRTCQSIKLSIESAGEMLPLVLLVPVAWVGCAVCEGGGTGLGGTTLLCTSAAACAVRTVLWILWNVTGLGSELGKEVELDLAPRLCAAGETLGGRFRGAGIGDNRYSTTGSEESLCLYVFHLTNSPLLLYIIR